MFLFKCDENTLWLEQTIAHHLDSTLSKFSAAKGKRYKITEVILPCKDLVPASMMQAHVIIFGMSNRRREASSEVKSAQCHHSALRSN